MKQLISLLLIISITIISWSSYAKSTDIRINAIYAQPSYTVSSMVLKPSLSNKHINEDFTFTSKQSAHKHNNLFELAIIFNEKLQQVIAFFTDLSEEVEEVASNVFVSTEPSSSHELSRGKKCNTSN